MNFPTIAALLLIAGCSSEPAAEREQSATASPVGASPAPAPEVLASADPSPSPTNEAIPLFVRGKFAPRDECAVVPGAIAFRLELANAVRTRNASALAILAEPAIKLDFGGGTGKAALRERFSGPGGKELWAELDQILPLGCALDHGNLVLPWLFTQDLGKLDPYSAMIVIGNAVPMHGSASDDGRVVATLSWTAVDLVKGLQPEAAFQQVRVPGGPSGYIATASLRSPLDYRIIASRKNGDWRIGAFIAGD
jgi:hypothetical protein